MTEIILRPGKVTLADLRAIWAGAAVQLDEDVDRPDR